MISLAPKALVMAAVSSIQPVIQGFYDSRTFSVQYVASCPETGRCAIIDPVLDYDEKSGSIKTTSADAILDYIATSNLVVQWILDTHPHADHFSAARYLRDKTGAPTATGAHVVDVQKIWKRIYNLAASFPADGSQWDRTFVDGETFRIGNLDTQVLHSPGHTLASITFLIGNAAFIHDTLFMPDSGTARADFPGGDAVALWRSIQRILSLPDMTRLFTGHDYQPGGRNPLWESTVAEQKAKNLHLVMAKSEDDFVAIRQARDATLPMPKLILHALQFNIRGGELPEPEDNGMSYLKIPLSALDSCKW
jgi:glyoxylase-like metal-dependent hydrolase (beta-lactamase superfamily II)